MPDQAALVPQTDADAMRLAFAAAKRNPESPIGCVIVRAGRVLAIGHNEVTARHDPTAHAEIVTIRRACETLGTEELRGATLYSTLQPCGMCSMAIIWSKIGRVVYGAERHQVHKMYFEDRHFDTMDFIRDAFRDDLSFTGGVLSEECARLYHQPGEPVPEAEQGNL
jgi:tRNA(adenine34) deaminase